MSKNYTPISCDNVDWIEHFATLQQIVTIQFIDENGLERFCRSKIDTWKKNEDGEFIFLNNKVTPIRFDQILNIEGQEFKMGENC